MNAQLWVEVVGDSIIARVRGEPTEAHSSNTPRTDVKSENAGFEE